MKENCVYRYTCKQDCNHCSGYFPDAITSKLEFAYRDNRVRNPGWKKQWWYLVYFVLSAQATVEATEQATADVFEKYPRPIDLANADWKELEPMLAKVRFKHQKALRLIGCANVFLENNKQLPRTMEELKKYPGVGDKVAGCILNWAFNLPEAGVDVHVLRVSKRLGLVPERASAKKATTILKDIFKDETHIVSTGLFWLGYYGTCTARGCNKATCPLRKICGGYDG